MPTNDSVSRSAWAAHALAECNRKEPIVPFIMYDRLITQESGWRQYKDDGTGVLVSYSGKAEGIAQLHIDYYDEATRRDPFKNITASVQTLRNNYERVVRMGEQLNEARYKQHPWQYAVAGYNWGMGHITGYIDREGDVHIRWDGTRTWKCTETKPGCSTGQMLHYLDAILGPDWNEPLLVPVLQPAPLPQTKPGEPPMGPDFNVGEGLLNLMKENQDTPATDELFFKNAAGENQYSEAFGKSGNRYVYIVSTNRNYCFQPD